MLTDQLDESLICEQCLRYCWHDIPEIAGGILKSHGKRCALPYSNCICTEGDLQVFCISCRSPIKERKYSEKVAFTAHSSREIPGDKAGWYAVNDSVDKKKFKPHAFIAVWQGKTAGILITRLRTAVTCAWGQEPDRNIEPAQRWCVDRVWIYRSYRRNGLARKLFEAAAGYFEVELSEMGVLTPFSDDGEALARALFQEVVYLAR
jgi:GNAT superfamily N-acetyltransferase